VLVSMSRQEIAFFIEQFLKDHDITTCQLSAVTRQFHNNCTFRSFSRKTLLGCDIHRFTVLVEIIDILTSICVDQRSFGLVLSAGVQTKEMHGILNHSITAGVTGMNTSGLVNSGSSDTQRLVIMS